MNALAIRAFAALLVASVLVFGGCRWQAKVDKRAMDAHLVADAKATQRIKDAVARIERASVATVAAVDQRLTQEKTDALADLNRTVACLRDGTCRMRDRFRCPAGGAQAGASTGSGDAAAQGGLSGADAEFLVRFASEADEVTLQLGACQAIVKGDRLP